MFCVNCGSISGDEVCRVCGTPAITDANVDLTSPILAGWWRRVVATLVDSVVLFAPTVLLVVLLGNALGAIAAIAAQAVYLITLHTASDGQTMGNRLAQTRVRDALTGQPLTRRQAVLRWVLIGAYGLLGTLSSNPHGAFALAVSLLAVADCLYPLFNVRHQTIHDRLARTIVVRASRVA